MEQEEPGRTDGAVGVKEAVGAAVEEAQGYSSESEESVFSMSDSVHYTDSELDSEDECTDENCTVCAPRAAPQEEEKVAADPPRRLTMEELHRVQKCMRPLSSINYGPYRIFFDIEVDRDFLGRIIIHLSNEEPRCRNNIDKLCKGTLARRNNLKMHFTGTSIHRMVDGKFLEGGVLKPLRPRRAESLYDEKPVLENECYDSYITVASKNVDDDYNGARFLFTTTATVKHYDEDHIPIGCVVSGTDVIDALARLPCDDDGFFIPDITIAHCGSIKKTREEQWQVGKYEKSPKNAKNCYPYKTHDRIRKAASRNGFLGGGMGTGSF
uniref:PPIase cyclophilin-type domain-containing protein n=1 Tax=Caenorhabditis tropicalis TaxID=1561998 RepID=A0A1I7URR8_9PELO